MHSNEAEESVIGTLLLDNELIAEIGALEARHFYFKGEVFGVIKDLIDAGKSADLITVGEAMCKANSQLNATEVMSSLASIAESAVSLVNVYEYAQIIIEHNKNYRLHCIAKDLAIKSQDNESSDSVCAEISGEIDAILNDSEVKEVSFNDQLKAFLAGVDSRYNSGDALAGIGSGFNGLDEITMGFPRSDLILVGARPSMGKSVFAMNVARSAANADCGPVVVFSLEMPADQLIQRMAADIGNINLTKVRNGQLDNDDFTKLTAAFNIMSKWKDSGSLHIIDEEHMTMSKINSHLRRIERDHGKISMVVVDYLQMIKGEGRNRNEEIGEVSRDLKVTAKKFDTPLVVLSQLNRSLENRPNKRPINSDLRDSGSLEQDADLILFVYRDEVYNEDTLDKGIGEIIVSKNRNGELGTVRLEFVGRHTRFQDIVYGN